MSKSFVDRSAMVDWQVAPAEHEINNYDHFKIKYRQEVQDMIHKLSKTSAKKKTFVTISTNVLCADIGTRRDTFEPIDRDIYLPLEIALTKFCISDASKSETERKITTKSWMIDPGRPTENSNYQAIEHAKKHKIDYSNFSLSDSYIERDLQKVFKEINAFLTCDRTVFSTSLRHCRQDLGCLKWLNQKVGYKMKPVKVFSGQDLYVVLLRYLSTGGEADSESADFICHGVAEFQFDKHNSFYELEDQCKYHQHRTREFDDGGGECAHCAHAVSRGWCNATFKDLSLLTAIVTKQSTGQSGDEITERIAAVSLQD